MAVGRGESGGSERKQERGRIEIISTGIFFFFGSEKKKDHHPYCLLWTHPSDQAGLE